MKWFGEYRPAPVCWTCERTATPVDKLCVACSKPIEPRDCGYVLPGITAHSAFEPKDLEDLSTVRERERALRENQFAWHHECFFAALFGSSVSPWVGQGAATDRPPAPTRPPGAEG